MTTQADLSVELSRLQLVLEKQAPATASGLARAAPPEVIDSLRRVLGLDSVPRDLAALYGWHDGQLPGAPPIQGNRVLLSVEAAIGAWRFLNDPQEDHSNSLDSRWLPVLYNGAGDYVVSLRLCAQMQPRST